jgi:hypothetical protein
MANKTDSNAWTRKQLANFGKASASGYVPGLQNDDVPTQDEWTTQRHLQAAKMRTQVFIPGF